MLSNKKSKAYQLKQLMEKLDIKSLNEIEGKSRAERKLLFLALEAKAESSPNGPVAKKVDEIRKASIDYSTRAILAIRDNPALSKGMISSIRKEFPLRAVCDNEETMAIGKVSVDKKVMEEWNHQHIRRGFIVNEALYNPIAVPSGNHIYIPHYWRNQKNKKA